MDSASTRKTGMDNRRTNKPTLGAIQMFNAGITVVKKAKVSLKSQNILNYIELIWVNIIVSCEYNTLCEDP